MFSINNKLFRDLLLVILGVLGAGWFFLQYPALHPFNNLEIEYSREEIIAKSDSTFQSWQFQSNDFLSNIELTSSAGVLDSLQKKWENKEFDRWLERTDNPLKSLLFRWEIQKYDSESANERLASFGMSPAGEVVSFNISDELVRNQRPFNRLAVREVFREQVDELTRSLEDSLITGLIDYQHLNTGAESDSKVLQIISQLRELRGAQADEAYTMKNIWSLTDFYLERTVWKHFDLQKDSVDLLDEGGFQFARAYLSYSDSVSDINSNIEIDVLPAGSLKSISVDMQPELSESDKSGEILKTISFMAILLFAIWLLVIFYLRIKARALDTKPAMVIAVVAGFIVPGFTVLQFIQSLGVFRGMVGTAEIINSLMALAIFGAISAVGFFVLTAVSDSITRQYWPEKLKAWDLIRRGIFNNKPVGWVIIRALSIGGILIGIWIIILHAIPSLYLTSTVEMVSDSYAISSIANLLLSVLWALLLVVPVFLILANQILGLGGRKWLIPLTSAVIFALLDGSPVDLNPWYLEAISNFMVGFALGWFYLKFDFLAIALGFLIFLNLLMSAEGWLIKNSPDANVFYLFVFLVMGLIVLATYFVIKGTDREKLPEYVPAYIEDQAKEQRLQQELSIARVVQQTFLPAQIHRLPGIDIAGTCIPAQETGGDYYDMIQLGESRTAIAIGDVSGKGIRAAFYMTFTKGVLHSLSAIILSPVELLNQLNRLFNENATRGTFISMIYGILEADKRQFTFARAGHNPMLVVRKNGDTEWLQPKGIGVGMAKDDSFIKSTEEYVLKLKEGDAIILYTDGITEMLNSGNKFYGEERLERLVKGVRQASSAKILEIIIDDVNEFKGLAKQHDDMTLVIIKADASVNQ
ncbi:MAG: PP2C family protein-serine/threonine phosphatase [Balneolaceae bacterium]